MRNAFNRQHRQVICEALTIDNIGAGKGITAKLPMGAVITAITVLGVVAFNPSGQDAAATITVGDGTTTFVNAQSVMTVGAKTVDNVPKHYPQGGELSVSLAQAGPTAATAGKVVVIVDYAIVGAGDTVHG